MPATRRRAGLSLSLSALRCPKRQCLTCHPKLEGCRPQQLHVQPRLPQGRGLRRLSRQATPPRQEGLYPGEHGVLPDLSRRHESSEEVQHLPRGTARFRNCGLCHTAKNWTRFRPRRPPSGASTTLRAEWSPRHPEMRQLPQDVRDRQGGRGLPRKCVGCHGDRHKGLIGLHSLPQDQRLDPGGLRPPRRVGHELAGHGLRRLPSQRVRHPYVHQVPREQRTRRLIRRPDGSPARDSVLTSCCLGVTL